MYMYIHPISLSLFLFFSRQKRLRLFYRCAPDICILHAVHAYLLFSNRMCPVVNNHTHLMAEKVYRFHYQSFIIRVHLRMSHELVQLKKEEKKKKNPSEKCNMMKWCNHLERDTDMPEHPLLTLSLEILVQI